MEWRTYRFKTISFKHGLDTKTNTASDVWHHLQRRIALVESCLCVCVKKSAREEPAAGIICANSAMYGGLEVGRHHRPQELWDMRAAVHAVKAELSTDEQRQQRSARYAEQQAERARRVLERPVRPVADPLAQVALHPSARPPPRFFRWSTPQEFLAGIRVRLVGTGLPLGQDFPPETLERQAMLLDPFEASWGEDSKAPLLFRWHVASDITAGDMRGTTSFWSDRAGSSPTILRNSLDWASRRGEGAGTTDAATIARRYGGLVDVWPCLTRHHSTTVPLLALCLHEWIALQADIAYEAGCTLLLKVQSRFAAHIVHQGFERSPLAFKLGKLEGFVRDVTLPNPSLYGPQTAGRLSVVAASFHGRPVDALAMTSLDPGTVKYDPGTRHELLLLLDLVALKGRLAETFLIATRGHCLSAAAQLAAIEERSKAIGLEVMLEDARGAWMRKTHKLVSTRVGEREVSDETLARLAPSWDHSHGRFFAGPSAFEDISAAVEERLSQQGKHFRAGDTDSRDLAFFEELRVMSLVPPRCADFGQWCDWLAGLREGQDVMACAFGGRRNRKTGYPGAEGSSKRRRESTASEGEDGAAEAEGERGTAGKSGGGDEGKEAAPAVFPEKHRTTTEVLPAGQVRLCGRDGIWNVFEKPTPAAPYFRLASAESVHFVNSCPCNHIADTRLHLPLASWTPFCVVTVCVFLRRPYGDSQDRVRIHGPFLFPTVSSAWALSAGRSSNILHVDAAPTKSPTPASLS